MHRIALVLVAVCLAAAAVGGVASQARASNINPANVVPCLNGGWQNLMRSSGTTFKSQFECQQYAVFGGVPIPRCTAGSENFSEDAVGSKPTTFAGGTIEGPYASGGGVLAAISSVGLPLGTHFLYSGITVGPFRVTFTKAVSSLHVLGGSDSFAVQTVTLTAYDSSGVTVGTDKFTGGGQPAPFGTMTVSSATNNIKYFTMQTTESLGLGIPNIVWGCT